jgi:UDP-N-acetylglucosamine 2-epimerase (non-hydrolysing)
MKIAPIVKAIDAYNKKSGTVGIEYMLVHTGQHYDHKMSGSFFEQLGIPEPDANLEAGGGTQAEQTAAIMIRFEKFLLNNPADLVVVVGDVTSTMACTIAAKKLCIKVAHVEAGIRSGDMEMPEEINRIVTDSICDYFYTTSIEAGVNLQTAGVAADRIFFVGNTMIDTLIGNLDRLIVPDVVHQYGLINGKYWVLTMHRPANVDNIQVLERYLHILSENSGGYPIIFPVHPRTLKNLTELKNRYPHILPIDPLSYLEFIYLVKNCLAVVTDSGGITEEATVLKVPCMTLRNSTERPETVTVGTNELLGASPDRLPAYMELALTGKWKTGATPALWDGKSGERITESIARLFLKKQ